MSRLFVATLASLFLFTACSSNSKKKSQDLYEKDEVLGRSDDLSSRPEWVKETVSVLEKNGKVLFIGLAEVPGDSRPSAAFKMSDAAARGGIAAKLETSVERLVESSDTGLGLDDQQLKTLIREVSQVNLRNIDVKDRYWEKLARTNSDGGREMVLKAFSLIEVPKSEIKKMLAARASKAKAPADVRNKVESMIRSQWSGEAL